MSMVSCKRSPASTAASPTRRDEVATEKAYGLVVDYHGVSRDLEDALASFDWWTFRSPCGSLKRIRRL